MRPAITQKTPERPRLLPAIRSRLRLPVARRDRSRSATSISSAGECDPCRFAAVGVNDGERGVDLAGTTCGDSGLNSAILSLPAARVRPAAAAARPLAEQRMQDPEIIGSASFASVYGEVALLAGEQKYVVPFQHLSGRKQSRDARAQTLCESGAGRRFCKGGGQQRDDHHRNTASRNRSAFSVAAAVAALTPIEFFEGILILASRLAVLEILREKLQPACRKRLTIGV